jgi:hypothetical protein
VKTLVATVAMASSLMMSSAWAGPLFVPGGTFTVVGGNTPDSFSQTVTLAPGTTALDNGALNLTISIVPVGDAAQDEWVVFKYQTTNGSQLSQPGQNWSLSQNGLPAAVPGNFVGDFTQFLDFTGASFNQTNHIFNQPLIANPVPGGTGNGEGTLGFASQFPTGPVFDLGAFADPFSIVTDADAGVVIGKNPVFGFVQALEFAPQTPVSAVPEPASMAVLGVGLLGMMAARRRRRG